MQLLVALGSDSQHMELVGFLALGTHIPCMACWGAQPLVVDSWV
jgi:hypothetical protein